MSKRRVVENLVFGGRKTFARRGHGNIVAVLTGTGTCTRGGTYTLVAPVSVPVASLNATGSVYITMTAGAIKGILAGTGTIIGTY